MTPPQARAPPRRPAPLTPMLTWAHGFEFARHVVGSCRVPAPRGQYSGEQWQIIASLLGIQTAAVGGFMFFCTSE
jgi:hypothetical protein